MSRPWLLITYRVPSAPSALRVWTWRTLRELGAISLSSGVYAIPRHDTALADLGRVVRRVHEGGGDALLLEAGGLTPDYAREIEARWHAAREDEFSQVIKSVRRFTEHVGREQAGEDYRFAEVEALDEELAKVRRQLEKVVRRDYLGSPRRADAEAAVAHAEITLATYLQLALEADRP